jgi:hypothetical protein
MRIKLQIIQNIFDNTMCYYLKSHMYNDPLFKSLDATYIIHLEGNGRYNDIEEQLKLYHPSKIVYILFNKGYKKCEKEGIHAPAKDLIHAYKYILEHAMQYNNVLILEDDFMFNPEVKEHAQNIDNFVNNHKNFIYRIGCIPSIQIPYNSYTNIGITCGSHATIYSKNTRNELLKSDIQDWDIGLLKYINYLYYKPLCYQLFPVTENQKHWGDFNPITMLGGKILIFLIKILHLDSQVEPGYSIMYSVSSMFPIIILAIIYALQKK